MHPKTFFRIQRKNACFILLIIFCLFTIGFIFNINQRHPKDSQEMFLENVMIRELGLYVLLGSKPMSTFTIESGFPETEEECKKNYDAIKAALPEYKYSYEEYTRSCLESKFQHTQYLWNSWKTNHLHKLHPRYMMVSRKNPFGERHEDGLFINKPSTIFIMTKYYEDFLKVTGQSFDPSVILDEICDNNSIFWNRVFENHYLQGLLLGYGERNSFEYNWARHNLENMNYLSYQKKSKEEILNLLHRIYLKKTIKVADLPLPMFGSYSISDPLREKYEKEREKILFEVSDKNFKTSVLEYLFCSDQK